MKKVMIGMVSLCAMACTAFASCTEGACNYAYRIKLSGKTVKGVEAAAENACSTSICYAKPASFRLAGYAYGMTDDANCGCACLDWTGGGANCHFWDENKVQKFADIEQIQFDLIEVLRNNGAMNKVQVSFKIGDIHCVGFGKFNPTTKRLESANGFFTGVLAPAQCVSAPTCDCQEGTPTPAYAYNPCELTSGESAGSVAYGRWTMTYKADKVATLNSTGDTSCLYPSQFKAIK